MWVALAAAFSAAFIGWQELRSLDSVVRNYSKVVLELNIIFDHWKNLEGEERNQTEFYKTVRSTEDILWSQNVEYIKAMQEALRDSDLEEEASLVNRVIKEQRDSDIASGKGLQMRSWTLHARNCLKLSNLSRKVSNPLLEHLPKKPHRRLCKLSLLP